MANEQKPKKEFQLPADWPQYTTSEYYTWMMERMPPNAMPSDWSKHQPHNSYGPIFWYEDKEVQCCDCACQFIFSKEEQQHWYEILRLPIYARAIRCVSCRAIAREKKRAYRAEQLKQMEEAANRVPHPNEAFFKQRI